MIHKTHKGTSKRMKVSKTGKVKRRKSGARHLKSNKTGRQKRQSRGTAVESGRQAKVIREAVS